MKRIHFPRIDSTHTWARIHLDELPTSEITLITADEQTAGEGQFRRKWLSPPRVNLLATFHTTLPAGQRELETLAQLLTLSAATSLIEMGFPISIKWPNDLLLDGKKVAGVRVEMVMGEDVIRVIASIGVNINMPEEALDEIDQPAISLALYFGEECDIAAVRDTIATQFEGDFAIFCKSGFAPFRPLLEGLQHLRV